MDPTLIHRRPAPTKKLSGTTFYTLFAFGGACGAFLSGSQNRGIIPFFWPIFTGA